MRRTLIIVVLLLVLIALGVGAYLFLHRQAGLTAQTSSSVQNPFGATSGDASGGSSSNGGGGSVSGDIGSPIPGIAVQAAPNLIEISAAPVAKGVIALDPSTAMTTPSKKKGAPLGQSSTTPPTTGVDVRYIDRESGNMFSYDTQDQNTTRLTDHTAPGVEEASWIPDGSLAYLRFLTTDTDGSQHIDTYALPADNSDGFMLARDLGQVLPIEGKIFAFMPSTDGSVGALENTDGSGATTLFSSPLSALTFKQDGSNLIAYTNPSSQLSGYAFLVTSSGSFTRILGPLTGLSVTPSATGRYLLISYLTTNGLGLFAYDTTTHALTALPIATLAEKCAWEQNDIDIYCFVPTVLPPGLPDSWYQGTALTQDRLWKIDMAARVATQVADLPTLTSTAIDAMAPTLDANGSMLVFMNKLDDSLWAYTF